MKVEIRGPVIKENLKLWEFSKAYTEILQESGADLQPEFETETDEARRNHLRQEIKANEVNVKQLQRLFGPPEIRRSSRVIQDMDDDLGLNLKGYKRLKAKEG